MSRPSPDLARLRQRVMLAVGLPPLVLSVAVGCATGDKADFDALDSERATTSPTSLTAEGAAARPAARVLGDIDQRGTFGVRLPGDRLIYDYVNTVDIHNAPRDAHVEVYLDEVAPQHLMAEGFTHLDGGAQLSFLMPADFDVAAEPSLIVHITTEAGHTVRQVLPVEMVVPITDYPQLEVLHPDLPVEALVMGADYRACSPQLGEACVDVVDFHDWEARQLVAYALDQSLPPDMTAEACLDDDASVGDCCYVVNVGFKGQAPVAHCEDPTDPWADYTYDYTYSYSDGRPFTTAEGSRQADTVAQATDWAQAAQVAPPADPALRAAVVDAWTATAQGEHASIASFSRFQLELLALGAPAELLGRAAEAIADEVRHAQLAFRVASAMAGEPVSPAGLSLEGALARSTDEEAVLVGAIVEGCINETIASLGVQRAAAGTNDAALARALTEVADDEARHAELSWAFVRWMLAERPHLVPVAREAFEGFTLGPAPHTTDDPRLAAYGVMGPVAQHRVATEVLERVVRPAAEALLAAC